MRLRNRYMDPNIVSNIVLVVIIAVGAAITFAMFALAARCLGPERFGTFVTWFSVLSFTSVASVLGQETLITRSWNEHAGGGRLDLAAGALIFGLRNSLLGAAMATVAILFIGSRLHLDCSVLMGAGALAAVQPMLLFTNSASRSIAGVFTSTTNFEITWRLTTVLALLLAVEGDYHVGQSELMWLLVAGMVLAAAVQASMSYRALPPNIDWSQLAFDNKTWRRRCMPMWGAALLEAINQYADVILIGVLIDPVAAGAYFAAARIASAFSKVSAATYALAASRVSLLYFNHPRAELVNFICSLAPSVSGLVGVGLVIVSFFGPYLLRIFGPIYAHEFWTLMVLSVGTAISALSGPGPCMLLQTGHEGLYTRLMTVGLMVRFLLMVLLAPALGALGAALAFTLASLALCIAINVACRQRVGMDPSVFCLFRRTPGMPPPTSTSVQL